MHIFIIINKHDKFHVDYMLLTIWPINSCLVYKVKIHKKEKKILTF